MQIYNFYSNGENALCLVDETKFGYFWNHFVGKPMARGWHPPKFSIVYPYRPVRDFVSWSDPIVSERAKNCLEPVIGPFVEFLPFASIKGKSFYAVNVLEVIDCLNRRASEPCVGKFVFNEKKLRPVPIFKVPKVTHIFVSDVFAQIVVDHKLTGAGFDDPENFLWVKKPWNRTMEGLPPVKNFDVKEVVEKSKGA